MVAIRPTATRRLQALHPGKEALIAAFYDRFDEMLRPCLPARWPNWSSGCTRAGVPLYLLSNAPGFLDAWLRGPAADQPSLHRPLPRLRRVRRVGCCQARCRDLRTRLPHGGFSPQRRRVHRRRAWRTSRARAPPACAASTTAPPTRRSPNCARWACRREAPGGPRRPAAAALLLRRPLRAVQPLRRLLPEARSRRPAEIRQRPIRASGTTRV